MDYLTNFFSDPEYPKTVFKLSSTVAIGSLFALIWIGSDKELKNVTYWASWASAILALSVFTAALAFYNAHGAI